MNSEELRAERMRQLELELNRIKFNDIEIGSIMALYWGQLFRNTFGERILMHFAVIIKYHFLAIKPKSKIKDQNKSLLYFKTGNHRHLQRLEDAVVSGDYLKSHTLVVGLGSSTSVQRKAVMNSFSLKEVIEIWSFFAHRGFNIWNLLKEYQISKFTRIILFLVLFCQLAKAQSTFSFFNSQKNIKLIAGDYDRGADTAVWFAVAKAKDFKSFTLQHGVINPPYGYNPLIADEIWVWGEMAKQQLISLGVEESQIKIMGTPIIDEIEISEKTRQNVINKLKLKNGFNVMLALSTPDIINDRKLVAFFKEIQTLYGKPNDNFLIKLHPARSEEKFRWVTDEFGIKILPNPMVQSEFMNLVDILLVHSSGIATEALYYGIKVGVLDILDESPGNGLEINKYCGVPLLKEVSDFEKVYIQNMSYIKDQVFYAVGQDAKSNINKLIHEALHS